MKKILSLILFILLVPSLGFGATCTAQGAGDWWTAGTWSCGGSARVPAADDDVALAGYIITWDVANGVRIPATSGSLGTVTSTASQGQITVDLSAAACNGDKTCTFHATTITAGTKPSTGNAMLYVTGTADATDILGVYGAVTGGSNTSAGGVQAACANGTVYIEGNVTGGSGNSSYGAYASTSGKLVIVGNVTGGSCSTSAPNCGGAQASGSGTLTITGNLIDSQFGLAVGSGRPPLWNPGYANYHSMYLNGSPTSLYQDTDPGVANVKKDTTYYFNSGTVKTGTYEAAGGGGGAWGF